jgi:hypothetical protein
VGELDVLHHIAVLVLALDGAYIHANLHRMKAQHCQAINTKSCAYECRPKSGVGVSGFDHLERKQRSNMPKTVEYRLNKAE